MNDAEQYSDNDAAALDAALSAIAERRPQLIDLGLSRVEAALSALGNPHHRLPPTIHVAGTNGKGSTIAFMKAALEASGAKTHVFTSPHLVRYNERIVLAGGAIDDAPFMDILHRVDAAVAADQLTFFETLACAAFVAFDETPADYVLLEVGLGGRLDATNVIDRPACAVVTPIAFDHQQFLGDTLAKIAAEKAGIFKKDAPAVVGPQTPEAMAALERCANESGAALFAFGTHWNAYAEQGRLIYQDDDGLADLTPPRLFGAHQTMNAGLAIAALKAAGARLSDEELSKGLQNAVWPARLQRLTRGPLVDQLQASAPPGSELWLDGGHNPHAARALAAAFSDFQERAPAKFVLIAGLQANKDAEGYFAAFEGVASAVFAVSSSHAHAACADDMACAAERARLPAHPCASVAEALALICDGAQGGEPLRVLIGGSLYLAGEILAENG